MIWLGLCEARGWVAEVQSDGMLKRLAERRREWRSQRERGEVALDGLMPIETEMEERWKYWVEQPLSAGCTLGSIREIKIFDPACGSGHFLVIAFDLLFALYLEEARHRGEEWSGKWIATSILENNLYGLDIDPRAVQIAAAALVLKGKKHGASPGALNLVASNLQLAALPEDDSALVELKRAVWETVGIPQVLTQQIVQALKGADQWGSLLKVDGAVEGAIAIFEKDLVQLSIPGMAGGESVAIVSTAAESAVRKDLLLKQLERFLGRCTKSDDLGLRLRGEQLAAGVRFIRMVREGVYDLVVGNPPYQGTKKLRDIGYLEAHYSNSNANLYATFLERGLQLTKPNGISALLTLRTWMFLKDFSKLRQDLLSRFDLILLGDVDRGAFEEVPDEIVATVMSIFQKSLLGKRVSIAIQPTPLDDNARDNQRTNRKRAAVLAQVGRFEFRSDRFRAIKEQPIVYWWDEEFCDRYRNTPKLGDESDVKQGLATASNPRFLRQPWEVNLTELLIRPTHQPYLDLPRTKWVPYIKGAEGKSWFEPLSNILLWEPNALAVKLMERDGKQTSRPQNERYYFQEGAAVAAIGAKFKARIHRFRSVFDVMGQSVFPKDTASATCLMNTQLAHRVLVSLNPSIHFQVGDIKRLPLFPIESADEIFAQLDRAFTQHEAARETSVEFQQPGDTCWNYAQAWAQQAVDRPAGTPLPDWEPVYETPPASHWVSFAIGVALGRFPAQAAPLPHGILYLSAYSADRPDSPDSLNHPASQPIHDAWAQHGGAIGKTTLHKWLRLNFFKDLHLGMYENRPIYFPLSSKSKNFVAHISIHRWHDTTLTTLLSDYLVPEFRQLEGELADLLETRSQGDTKSQTQSEKRYSDILQLRDELKTFIDQIRQTAEQHPPQAHPKAPTSQTSTRFIMNLDDGVMINSAALWNLLEPQWTKPKTWWLELCTAQGKKDYDWSHLAARYFRDRVDAKCQKDPSLAVAHGCFWKYHPAKAYEWELRLQDEIAPNFTINENERDRLRIEFETNHPQVVAMLKEKEEKRRDRKRKKAGGEDDSPLFEQEWGEEE
jgi:hypothetical protein